MTHNFDEIGPYDLLISNPSHQTYQIAALMQKSKVGNNLFEFLSIFPLKVWSIILASLLIYSAILWVQDSFKKRIVLLGLVNSIMMFVASTFGQTMCKLNNFNLKNYN